MTLFNAQSKERRLLSRAARSTIIDCSHLIINNPIWSPECTVFKKCPLEDHTNAHCSQTCSVAEFKHSILPHPSADDAIKERRPCFYFQNSCLHDFWVCSKNFNPVQQPLSLYSRFTPRLLRCRSDSGSIYLLLNPPPSLIILRFQIRSKGSIAEKVLGLWIHLLADRFFRSKHPIYPLRREGPFTKVMSWANQSLYTYSLVYPVLLLLYAPANQ